MAKYTICSGLPIRDESRLWKYASRFRMIEPVVTISAIEHYVYCPRQCALIHGDGVWADNPHTIRGHRAHRRVDDPDTSRKERCRRVLRAVPLWSERYGLSGRADVIEIHSDTTVVPVEYKAGVRHGHAADLQLCAQAICLEDMLKVPVSEGFVWYGGTRRRWRVDFDLRLRAETLRAVSTIRAQIVSGQLPPAPNDARCSECQLIHHCLPGVVSARAGIADYIHQAVWGK